MVCLHIWCLPIRLWIGTQVFSPLPPPPRWSLTRNIPVYINQSSGYCMRRGDKVRTIVMPGRVISPPLPFPLRAHLHFFLIQGHLLTDLGTQPRWRHVSLMIICTYCYSNIYFYYYMSIISPFRPNAECWFDWAELLKKSYIFCFNFAKC